MELILGKRIGFARFGDGDGEQSISDGLSVSIGKVFLRQVVEKRGSERFVQLAQFAFFALAFHQSQNGIANIARQRRQSLRKLFRRVNHVTEFMLEGFCPLFAPVVYVGGVLRPLEVGGEGFFYVVGFEFGIIAVPAEDAQSWCFIGVRFLVEVSE